MSVTKYIKALLNPYQSYLKLRLKSKRAWINKNCKSFYDVFEYEKDNDFSYTKLKAKLSLGCEIDLENPRTFNEKLIHRRLFSRDPIWPVITDKIAVRDWLKEQGYLDHVHLVPAKVAYSVEELMEIPIDRPVVVKAAWASGMNLFVSSNKELEAYKSTLENWLKSPYAPERLIWAPEEMQRGFLVEDSIADEDGNVPLDYKFHCFNGRVEFLQVDIDRFKQHKRLMFSREGELLDWIYGKEKYSDNFDLNSRLIQQLALVAEKLSENFSYIRVDLYCYKSKIYFGELTQTQGAGFEKFSSPELNCFYGNKWIYPESNKLGDLLITGIEL